LLVEQSALSPLVDWESFYVIVGSSAAVLIGLQFVAMTLSAEVNVRGGGGTVVGAFAARQWFTSAPSCSSR
jgi:hypothetical protein